MNFSLGRTKSLFTEEPRPRKFFIWRIVQAGVMDQLSQLLEDPNAKIVFGITVVGVVAAVAYQVSSSKPGNQVTAVKKVRTHAGGQNRCRM